MVRATRGVVAGCTPSRLACATASTVTPSVVLREVVSARSVLRASKTRCPSAPWPEVVSAPFWWTRRWEKGWAKVGEGGRRWEKVGEGVGEGVGAVEGAVEGRRGGGASMCAHLVGHVDGGGEEDGACQSCALGGGGLSTETGGLWLGWIRGGCGLDG